MPPTILSGAARTATERKQMPRNTPLRTSTGTAGAGRSRSAQHPGNDGRSKGAPATDASLGGVHAGSVRSKEHGRDRLGRTDWIEAGQAILREKGISAVKLAALTQRLGVSIGSFYHHFANFEAYLGALAEHYSVERVHEELERARAGEADPIARIRRLGAISSQRGTFDLDLAMRVWATMDPRAERTLRKAEELVLEFLAQSFRDLGFDADQAGLRARILLSANIATLGGLDEQGHARFLRECLALLARPSPDPSAKA